MLRRRASVSAYMRYADAAMLLPLYAAIRALFFSISDA